MLTSKGIHYIKIALGDRLKNKIYKQPIKEHRAVIKFRIGCYHIMNNPEELIDRYFNSLKHGNAHVSINQHFHLSINDKQISKLLEYLQSFRYHWCIESKNLGEYTESEVWIFHETCRKEYRKDKVLIRCELDDFYQELRITGLRVMNPKTWNVRKTIFRVNPIQVSVEKPSNIIQMLPVVRH